MLISPFDQIAAEFERLRALPAGVSAAVRRGIWDALDCGNTTRVLEVGAGTGRIGEAFLDLGDRYVAVDTSQKMLGQFAEKASKFHVRAPSLVQADGRCLPLPEQSFDIVLMIQVVSGLPGWRQLLDEARRVLCASGAVVLGRAQGPDGGIDQRMRTQLGLILTTLGADATRPGAGREEARLWLSPSTNRTVEVVAGRWVEERTPRQFLIRHASGARFAALAASIREEALRQLTDWAVSTFGTLDSPFAEQHAFVLDVFVF
jgi:ubiquinone/menaquinone biosynthesis C-methylase UbiE